jgi:hypothetical protein
MGLPITSPNLQFGALLNVGEHECVSIYFHNGTILTHVGWRRHPYDDEHLWGGDGRDGNRDQQSGGF